MRPTHTLPQCSPAQHIKLTPLVFALPESRHQYRGALPRRRQEQLEKLVAPGRRAAVLLLIFPERSWTKVRYVECRSIRSGPDELARKERDTATQNVLEASRRMRSWAGRPDSSLLAPFLAASCLLLVGGSHQEFHEATGSRIHHQTNQHTHEVHCSRERSRAAWKAIDEYLMPFVEKEKYELPSKCRLHAENDMFREQEEHKIHFDVNEWRCGFCKKSFRAEKYIDQHFSNRHNNLLDNSQGRCLADLCGALHCDLTMEFKKPKSKCNAAAAARNRHLCESLADNCFPVNQGHSASRLHEFFLRQFCDAHTCNGGSKPFPKGGRKQTNRFYLALCILTLLLLPLFYLIVFLHQREMKKGVQVFKRIPKTVHKKKPS